MKPYQILLVCLLPFCAAAQSNYQQGFCITLTGDTLHGYVDFRDWSRNPNFINFKYELNQEPKRLGVDDIRSFKVEGAGYYEQHKVTISGDGVDLSNAPSVLDYTATTGTVFLRVLQTGKNLILFDYRDALKTRYYIKSDTMQQPAELVYKVYMNPDGSNTLITRNDYMTQLYQLAVINQANSSGLQQKIEKTRYREDDLVKIISIINGDKNDKEQATYYGKRSKVRFFAGLAFNLGTLKYDQNSPFPNASPAAAAAPRLSVGFDALMSSRSSRLLFRTELAFSGGKYMVTNTDNYTYNNAQRTNTQELSQITFSVIPQAVYHVYYSDQVKIFIDAGLSFNFSAYPTNSYHSTSSNDINPNGSHYPEMRAVWFSIPLKAGVTLADRFEIFGTYVPPAEVTSYTEFTGRESSFQIGINYLFGNKKKASH
ncbi:MAG TPA: hypothetical protein VG890_09660 [Puia sp.]|nr:hypothetical protein [Puia sp.]